MTHSQSNFLDAIRGIAAQLVLIGHIHSTAYPGQNWAIGDLGVILFFILSGFLIAYTAQARRQKGNYGLANFISDRFFRIFVPYVPALALVVAVDTFVLTSTGATQYAEHYTYRDFFATLLMLQQYPLGAISEQFLGWDALKLSTFGSARPWWTVAIEWWLYVTFGMLLFSSIARRDMWRYLALLLVVAIVPLANAVAWTGEGLSLVWFIVAGFALGYLRWKSAIDYWAQEVLDQGLRARLVVLIVLSLTVLLAIARVIWISLIEPGSFSRPYFYDFNFYILLVFAFVIVMILLGLKQRSARLPVVRFVADYSYSLYLLHYSLIVLLDATGHLRGDSMSSMVLCFVFCNVAAIAFFILFERHHKRVQRFIEATVSARFAVGWLSR